MGEKKYNILKAASWYTVGNILIKGVSFFVLPVFTRLMNTHEYGVYSVYTSYLMIFETVILLGLSSTVALAKYAKEVEYESYISTILAIPALLTFACMGIVNICIPFTGNILSMDAVLWNCLFVTAGTGAICNIIGAKLVIEGNYKLFMISSAIQTIGNVAISLLLAYTVYKSHDVHLARVFGNTVTSIICAIYLLLATKTKITLKKINVKYAFAWGIPLLFHTVATVVLTQSDRILIRYLDSYSSAGIYAVATTIITIPMVLQQSLHQAWTPWFYGKLDKREYQQIQWLNNRYIILYGAIIAAFMLLAPDIIHLFTEESYWPCIYSLVPLSISVFAELLYGIPTSVEYYNKKTTMIMKATLITVILNIILDIIFIKAFGYHGAAYATALSKLVLFIMHYIFARKIDSNHLFSNKIVIIAICFLAVLNVVIVLTLDWFILRYILLLMLIVPTGWYVIKNKATLFQKLKEN